MFNLTKNVKVSRVSNAVAAGQTTINATSVDMLGFAAVVFAIAMGAITGGAVTSVKLQQSSDNGSADDFTDIEGSSTTIGDTDDNKVVLLEIVKPKKRYVRAVISRATQDSVVDGIFALQHLAGDVPVTQPTTVLVGDLLNGPGEGTA